MSGSLVHSPAQILQYLLIQLSQGTLPSDAGSWPIYTSETPNKPDICITTLDTSGMDAGRTSPDNERQEFHGIQVLIRASDHSSGYTKSRAIAIALDGVARISTTISSSVYHIQSIKRTSDVIVVGTDKPEGKRSLFTVNCLATIRQTV